MHPSVLTANGRAGIPSIQIYLGTNEAGDVMTIARMCDPVFRNFPSHLYWPAVLAISLINCKNVAQRDSTNIEGPSEKWLRRKKAPVIRYHTLDIQPMREVLKTEGRISENGLHKAMHLCRGHFAHYSEDKPLFGKYAGTFWKPQHVRGKAENGIVLKDYSVAAK